MGKVSRRVGAKRDVMLSVGYHKPGDDFASALEQSKGDPVAALVAWAAMLEDSASALRRVADVLRGAGVTSALGGAHHVEVHDVPEALIPSLKATGAAYCRDEGPEDGEED